MSEQRTEGLLVSQDDGVYFIPDDKLAGFKIADDAAEGVREAVGEAEVSGFKQMGFSPEVQRHFRPAIKPIAFAFRGPIAGGGPLQNTYSLAVTAT